MFIEPKTIIHEPKVGWIELICGSMFSGKTEELIRRVRRAVIAQRKVKIFKPKIDIRYHKIKVVSHNKNEIQSVPVANPLEILKLIEGEEDVIAIDEAQFFENSLVDVVTELANDGYRVILSGLDMDFEGKPFGVIPGLMGIAEYVTKLHAVCKRCGNIASFSYRLTESNKQVLLGEQEEYEARCRRCFIIGMEEKRNKLTSQKITF